MPSRRRHPAPTLLLAAIAFTIAGCAAKDDEPAPEPKSAAMPTEVAKPEATPYREHGALLDHLKSVSTSDDALGLFDLVFTRSMAERVLIERLMARERARLNLHAALRDAFPDEVEPVEDLGMGWLAKRLAGATINRTEGRRAFADYTDEEGQTLSIVLLHYRESWWLAPETFSGGPAIDDLWFISRQRYFNSAPMIYERAAEDVRDGAHASAADAMKVLSENLGGRLLEFGTIGFRRAE